MNNKLKIAKKLLSLANKLKKAGFDDIENQIQNSGYDGILFQELIAILRSIGQSIESGKIGQYDKSWWQIFRKEYDQEEVEDSILDYLHADDFRLVAEKIARFKECVQELNEIYDQLDGDISGKFTQKELNEIKEELESLNDEFTSVITQLKRNAIPALTRLLKKTQTIDNAFKKNKPLQKAI